MFPIVCVGDPTGAGKDTIVMEFLKKYPTYVRIPRTTTRASRPHEIPGVHYYFLDEKTFDEQVAAGAICAVDHFCGEKYGIDMRKINEAVRSGKQIIGVFGVCAFGLREAYTHGALLVYITAPLELLEKRLVERGDSSAQIKERMIAAQEQLAREPQQFDYVIENTRSVTSAVDELFRVISCATSALL
jgi:guanylate kinase